MIKSKSDFQFYLTEDAKANQRNSVKAKFLGDEIWKYIVCLRKTEYYKNCNKRIRYLISKFKLHSLSIKLGFQIPINTCGYGLSLPHYGTVIIANNAKIGNYCRIHEGVTIGSTNGDDAAAIIGDRVFIASGAKIIGKISIANDCAIGSNAVVVKSICEEGTTWGGVPVRKISDNDSHSNLTYWI